MLSEPDADVAYRQELESIRREIHFKWDGAGKSEKQVHVALARNVPSMRTARTGVYRRW